MATPVDELMEEVKCYACLGLSQSELLILALLSRISQGGSSEEDYLVYRALVSQNGTSNPTVVIIENTIGDIQWIRDDVGTYLGSLTGAFPLNETLAMISNNSPNPGGVQFSFLLASEDQLTIRSATFNPVGPQYDSADGVLDFTPIEIRVRQ